MKIKKYDQKNKIYMLLGLSVLCVVAGINGMNLVPRTSTKMELAAQKKQNINLVQLVKSQNVDNLVKLVQLYFMDDAWKNLSEEALKDLVNQYKECMKFIDLKNNEQDKVVFGEALSKALNIPLEDIDVPYAQMTDFELSIFGNQLISLIEDYLVNNRWKDFSLGYQQEILRIYKECLRFIDVDNEKEAEDAFNRQLAAKGLSEQDQIAYIEATGRFEDSDLYKNSK